MMGVQKIQRQEDEGPVACVAFEEVQGGPWRAALKTEHPCPSTERREPVEGLKTEGETGLWHGDGARGKEEHRSCPGPGRMEDLAERMADVVCGVHSGHQREPHGFASRGMVEHSHRLRPCASSR